MFDQSLRVCLIVWRCYKKQCRGPPTDRSPIQGVLPDIFKQDSHTRKKGSRGPHWSSPPFNNKNEKWKRLPGSANFFRSLAWILV